MKRWYFLEAYPSWAFDLPQLAPRHLANLEAQLEAATRSGGAFYGGERVVLLGNGEETFEKDFRINVHEFKSTSQKSMFVCNLNLELSEGEFRRARRHAQPWGL